MRKLQIEAAEEETLELIRLVRNTRGVNLSFGPGRVWLCCAEGDENHQALQHLRSGSESEGSD